MRTLQSDQGFWLSPQKVDDSGSEGKGQLALHTKQCTSRHLVGCCNLKRQQEVFERAQAWESRGLGSSLDSATNETLYDYEEATCLLLGSASLFVRRQNKYRDL